MYKAEIWVEGTCVGEFERHDPNALFQSLQDPLEFNEEIVDAMAEDQVVELKLYRSKE